MKNNKKIVAVLGAMSTLLTTGCTLKVDEKKLLEKLGEYGIEISMDGDNVEVTVKETTIPEITATTYTTKLTETTMTESTVLTTSTTKETTNATSNNSTTMSTTNTTSTTTNSNETTTTQKTIVSLDRNEPQFINRNDYFPSNNPYTISNNYIVNGHQPVQGKTGLTLWSIVQILNGKRDDKLAKKIQELNNTKDEFFENGRSLIVPFTTRYYKGNSVEEIAELNEENAFDLGRLNNILDVQETSDTERDILVKVLNENEDSYKSSKGTKKNIVAGTIINGDKIVECENTCNGGTTGILSLYNTGEGTNIVGYIEIFEDGTIISREVAKNVDEITKVNGYPVIKCNSEGDMYAKAVASESKTEEDFRTVIYTPGVTGTVYLYSDNNGKVISSFSNIYIPGFEQYNAIGGNQKTIG